MFPGIEHGTKCCLVSCGSPFKPGPFIRAAVSAAGHDWSDTATSIAGAHVGLPPLGAHDAHDRFNWRQPFRRPITGSRLRTSLRHGAPWRLVGPVSTDPL